MKHVAEARRQRGAKLVVVDPYRTGTAEVADLHLAPLPGTDGALACAVMHVLFAEGYADRAYMAEYTDDPAGLEAHLASRGPEWAARITGSARRRSCLRPALRADKAQLHPRRQRLAPAPGADVRGDLPPR
jgi:anaerobic selenocysteine-containing dehydrogenase